MTANRGDTHASRRSRTPPAPARSPRGAPIRFPPRSPTRITSPADVTSPAAAAESEGEPGLGGLPEGGAERELVGPAGCTRSDPVASSDLGGAWQSLVSRPRASPPGSRSAPTAALKPNPLLTSSMCGEIAVFTCSMSLFTSPHAEGVEPPRPQATASLRSRPGRPQGESVRSLPLPSRMPACHVDPPAVEGPPAGTLGPRVAGRQEPKAAVERRPHCPTSPRCPLTVLDLEVTRSLRLRSALLVYPSSCS